MDGSSESLTKITVEKLSAKFEHVAFVKQLGKDNHKTLGFFPEGAFDDYARAGTILIAVDGDVCAGYLLYRVSKDRATIVHLCVDTPFRGRGVTRELVNELVKVTKELRGVGLKCRHDYAENKMWPNLGFTFEREVRGRSHDGKPLVCWWRDHGHANLFSGVSTSKDDDVIRVIIDANIMLDLKKPEGRDAIPSLALQADWLEGLLELCVTDEIFADINRQRDTKVRQETQAFARRFPCLQCDNDEFDKVHGELKKLFPTRINDNTKSDIRQVARAITAKASFFLTRDTDMLKMRDDVLEQFAITILDPTALISHFDEVRNASTYQPVQFAGTQLKLKRLTASDVDDVAMRFQCHKRQEKKSHLSKSLREHIASRDQFDCMMLTGKADKPLALMVTATGLNHGKEMEVPIFRASADNLTPTIARQMVRHMLMSAAKVKAPLIHIPDEMMGPIVENALADAGFFEGPRRFQKFNTFGVLDTADIAKIGETLGNQGFFGNTADEPGYHDWIEGYKDWSQWDGPSGVSWEEHLLWPGKIKNSTIPNYIVSIKPCWAEQLFDTGLSSQNLFGRSMDLALNNEGVYYRAKRGQTITAPARVLWYVSDDKHTDGSMSIRACSRLVEVADRKPKDLFRKFRRLGVFSWNEVYGTAGKNLDKNIVALRYTDTELFPKPMHHSHARRILDNAGIRASLFSPIAVPNDVFFNIYETCIQ